ncbi:alpha-ketoacid dehydrogenase subunit beta [Ktedonosporobacter rubrisoli]|uniref:Alpha-ketoacid dehydrogenase subunit beta n=1 Tax=Ktedonosporobacter rubrisoli TaxID=2509675 RepID=A0A4V0YZ54_KTERU|nr:alpha-ketoacid dehydrogenase subunit beta [Ktedonosporobacter rubrisoli]QBD78531.1 alpha-ketoacid dehydrogenase subunit beta [Ktedonosporobacter rubrisoli]
MTTTQTPATSATTTAQFEPSLKEMTYAEAVREALSEEMRRDPRVFLMGEDVGIYGGAFGVTRGMLEEFGEERIRDTPISEAALAGAGTGAALTGMRPVVEFQFSDFMGIAMDQIVNQTAKLRFMFGGKAEVPVVFRGPLGSGTGAAAQHSQSLEAWFAHVPGLKVVLPSTPADVKGLLIAAIRDLNPVVFLEHKVLYKQKGMVPTGDWEVPIGKADIKRTGKDLTIIAWSIEVPRALAAAQRLAQDGIEAEVVDVRTLRPLDAETLIASARKTGRVLIVHEAVLSGGFGGEVAARIASSEAFYYLDAPIMRLGGAEIPIPYNPVLEKRATPQEEDIYQAACQLLQRNPA